MTKSSYSLPANDGAFIREEDRLVWTPSSRERDLADRPREFAAAFDDFGLELDGYQHVIDRSDVVLIACASKFHPMYAEAALKAGKHVFVEKPHGIDPVGIRRIRAACELAKSKNLSIVSGLQSRYHRAGQEIVKRLATGMALAEFIRFGAQLLVTESLQ